VFWQCHGLRDETGSTLSQTAAFSNFAVQAMDAAETFLSTSSEEDRAFLKSSPLVWHLEQTGVSVQQQIRWFTLAHMVQENGSSPAREQLDRAMHSLAELSNFVVDAKKAPEDTSMRNSTERNPGQEKTFLEKGIKGMKDSYQQIKRSVEQLAKNRPSNEPYREWKKAQAHASGDWYDQLKNQLPRLRHQTYVVKEMKKNLQRCIQQTCQDRQLRSFIRTNRGY
jgi:hypothetical protein